LLIRRASIPVARDATAAASCGPGAHVDELQDHVMTWSIIARDVGTGRIAIAVATRFFAVGAMVPHIATGVGAVATQAFVNPHYGPRGLALLRDGVNA
jgi:hypothetical protein